MTARGGEEEGIGGAEVLASRWRRWSAASVVSGGCCVVVVAAAAAARRIHTRHDTQRLMSRAKRHSEADVRRVAGRRERATMGVCCSGVGVSKGCCVSLSPSSGGLELTNRTQTLPGSAREIGSGSHFFWPTTRTRSPISREQLLHQQICMATRWDIDEEVFVPSCVCRSWLWG